MVILVDDVARENEGDLTLAAEKATPEAIHFMLQVGRGLLCVACDSARLDDLHVDQMVAQNAALHGTAFSVTIDHRDCTTGVSAQDRCLTIRRLADPESKPSDFVRPGHIFPLRAQSGGVLRRAGHTEAAVDLASMAGLHPCSVICEVLDNDGTMARRPQLDRISTRYRIPIISIAQIIDYRRRTEKLVEASAEARLPTRYGTFRAITYESLVDSRTHLALVMGTPGKDSPVLVRVHSECVTGDAFGSLRCDCRAQLQLALDRIGADGEGVIVYVRGHEGLGVGFRDKRRAYQVQEEGLDALEANDHAGFLSDERDFEIGAQILCDLGITSMRLLTNNLANRSVIEGFGLRIVDEVPLELVPLARTGNI
jgi:3,4-dihydroxy 2-butanone 4-phosphate synthase/GTP cyclohydrolase II